MEAQTDPKHLLIARKHWAEFKSIDVYVLLSDGFFHKAQKCVLSKLKFFYHIFEDGIISDKHDGLDVISLSDALIEINEKIFNVFYMKLCNFYFGYDMYFQPKTVDQEPIIGVVISNSSSLCNPYDQLTYFSMLEFLLDPADFDGKYYKQAAYIFGINWSKGFWIGVYSTFKSITHLKFLFYEDDLKDVYAFITNLNPDITNEERIQLKNFAEFK
jgi:hypothetical protein